MGKVVLWLGSVALLVMGGTATVRGQSALDGFDPNANGTVRVVIVQPDGKILIGGDFTTVAPNGGVPVVRNRIARLNPDGTLDIAFDPNANGIVFAMALQGDGKILVGGLFGAIGGAMRNRIARLSATTGQADSFDPNASSAVYAIAVQADGKVLVGGLFNGGNSIGGQLRNHLARLDAVSGLADSFNPNANAAVRVIAVQADGKILVGGDFNAIGGQLRNYIARLDAGTGLADSFNPNANEVVRAIAVQADGKILAGGDFAFGASSIGGQPRDYLARLDAATGLADSFNPSPGDAVFTIALQPNGKILVGGAFTGIGGASRSYVARLDPISGLADSFNPSANGNVNAIAVQADGKVLAGGDFTTLTPDGGAAVTRNHVARLEGSILYVVNTTSDVIVSGACANGAAGCSLRGAIEAANSHPGDDEIKIDLPAGSVINLTQVLPDMTGGITIASPGANWVTIRRQTGGNYRIFDVAAPPPGTVTFSGLIISNGLADGGNGFGGGIRIQSAGTVNVINCTLSGNTAATSDGGGISNRNFATLNITNSTISGNTCFNGGGGILNGASLNITNSTISGNTVISGHGGGIYNSQGTVNVTNSTICNNSAPASNGAFGGGIFNGSGSGGDGTLNVTNSTVSGNTANNGGGGIYSSGGATIKSSIIALNTTASGADPDVDGATNSFTSAGFNLIGKNDGGAVSFPAGNPNANNDIVGTAASPVDPKFDSNGLQNNGGLTSTIALLFNSPAIDKGTSNGLAGNLTTDQRGPGFARGFDSPATPNAAGGDGTDVGAFEFQPAPTTLANISTRLRVQGGENVLIGGMIVTGTAAKRVIVRARGPALSEFGVPGVLTDPTLELVQGNTVSGSNDDWRNSSQQAEIENSGFAPGKEAESAIITTLTPNQNYSAIVRGKNGEIGVGLMEIFDLDPSASSKLANISTRGLVEVDDNVMIAGLIVGPSGGGNTNVLVRALGPTLGDFGVQGFLANPEVELVNASGSVLRSNDDWKTSQRPEIEAAQLAPSHDAEAALVHTLPPGSYTAIVRGNGRTTGVGLVEVYNIP